jgi:hypothetical protein
MILIFFFLFVLISVYLFFSETKRQIVSACDWVLIQINKPAKTIKETYASICLSISNAYLWVAEFLENYIFQIFDDITWMIDLFSDFLEVFDINLDLLSSESPYNTSLLK